MINIFTDGATEGRNGKFGTVKFCGIGFYCPDLDFRCTARVMAHSNNEAEFKALITAMRWAIFEGIKEARFLLDSQIVVNRAHGRRPLKKKFRNKRMDWFQDRILELAPAFEQIDFVWIPREENTEADRLSKQSLYPLKSSTLAVANQS